MATLRVHADGSFLTTFEAGPHVFRADEPLSAGGADSAPTPYDYLAAALGGCTAMTLHVYAKRKSIPLSSVDLAISHDRTHAKDCTDCTSASGFIHRFEVEICLGGELSAEQKQELLSIAKRCPVAKTLQSEIRIEERLAD